MDGNPCFCHKLCAAAVSYRMSMDTPAKTVVLPAQHSEVLTSATDSRCSQVPPGNRFLGWAERQKIRGLDQGHKWDKVEETLKRGCGQPTRSRVLLLHTQSLERPTCIQISCNSSTREWSRNQSMKWESPIQEWCYYYITGTRRERIKLVPYFRWEFFIGIYISK